MKKVKEKVGKTSETQQSFSSALCFTTQALHWDRGRPARSERAARTVRLKLSSLRDHRTLRCS
jgi:hypothetical protein